MIREVLIFLLTPTTSIAKKYGFLYQSIALQHRFERCKKAWLPHLKNCQDLYLSQIEGLAQKKTVVILGSAHLHEIPMHLLVNKFEKITLVDVVHPLKHHWLAKRNNRLKLITQDLSGCLDKLESLSSLEELHGLINELKNRVIFEFEADLIVSSNIMSQLALLPIDAIEGKLKRTLSIEEKDFICSAFAEIHLKNLQHCQGHKLIYCDREVIYRDPQGEEIYKGHYPVNFSDFKKLKEWIWQLAPLKEASKDYSIEMKIEAYSLNG